MLNFIHYPIWFLFISAFVLTAIFVPAAIFLAKKIGALECGGYRKINTKPIPLLGGLSIGIPFVLLLFLLAKIQSNNFLGFLGIGAILILALGFLDDVYELRARTKLLGQIIIAFFTVLICLKSYVFKQIYLPFIGNATIGHSVSSTISFIWIVGLINAFNLIDGIDGLASGIAFIVSLALLALGILAHNQLLIILMLFLSGNLLAFLIFNFYPAKIFLGDTGSMFLGYIISVITLMGSYKSHTAPIILAPLLVLGFPIFETIVSMLRRFIRGLPIFIGDNHHTHHRLLSRGYSQRVVVLILCFVSLIFAIGAILESILPRAWLWLPVFIFIITLVFIAWFAGYLEPQVLNKIIYRRQQNTLLNAFAKYAILSFNSHANNAADKIYPSLIELCGQELRLDFLQIKTKAGEILLKYSKGHKTSKKYRLEKINTNTSKGQSILIEYRFDHSSDELEQHDVAICLSNIFSHIRLKL